MFKFKNKKKLAVSILAATVLSSTAASAAGFNYNYNYNTSTYPQWTWTVVNNYRPNKYQPPVNNYQPPVNNYEKPNNPSTPVETPAVGLSAVESEVVRLVNIERQKEGLQPLVASTELSNVARMKSADMGNKNYFSHTSPTYGSPFDMMKSNGIKYSLAGENIAKGQLTAASVVNAWMNSSGHRANIMNPSFNKIGVGHFKTSGGTNYWTQMFTN